MLHYVTLLSSIHTFHTSVILKIEFSFREISNLKSFANLKELVLDNNSISDGGFDLPLLPLLELLSLNKNKVNNNNNNNNNNNIVYCLFTS